MATRYRKFTEEDLREAVADSFSMAETLRKLELSYRGGNPGIKKLIIDMGIDIGHWNTSWPIEKSFEEVFCKDSTASRSLVKRQVIRKNLIPYICTCGNTGNWLNQILILELHHKNGNSKDNRIENLEFLCPNCHALTQTYCKFSMTD